MHNKILQFKLDRRLLMRFRATKAKVLRAYFLSHKHALIFVRACHQVRQYPSVTITPLKRGYMVSWLAP